MANAICLMVIWHLLVMLLNVARLLFLFVVIVLPSLLQVYLGEKFVNNPTLSDVTFLVEGGNLFSCLHMVFMCMLMLSDSMS